MSEQNRWRDGGSDVPLGGEEFVRGLAPTRGISQKQRAVSRAAITTAIVTASPAVFGAWTSFLSTKILIGVVAVGGLVGVVEWSRHRAAVSPVTNAHVRPVEHSVLAPIAIAEHRNESVISAEMIPMVSEPAAVAPVAIAIAPTRNAHVRAGHSVGSTDAGVALGDPLSREAAALESARALLDSNPSRALRILNASADEFRSGQLVAEREYMHIQVLQRLGRGAEARTRAQTFLTRFPTSSYSVPVRRIATVVP